MSFHSFTDRFLLKACLMVLWPFLLVAVVGLIALVAVVAAVAMLIGWFLIPFMDIERI